MQLLIEGTTKYGYNLMTLHTRDNTLIGFAVGHLVISMNECSVSTRIFYEAEFRGLPTGFIGSSEPSFVCSTELDGDDDTREFSQYLVWYYMDRIPDFDVAFRTGSWTNTNMVWCGGLRALSQAGF